MRFDFLGLVVTIAVRGRLPGDYLVGNFSEKINVIFILVHFIMFHIVI